MHERLFLLIQNLESLVWIGSATAFANILVSNTILGPFIRSVDRRLAEKEFIVQQYGLHTYRLSRIDENGIVIPKPGVTWNEFVAAQKRDMGEKHERFR